MPNPADRSAPADPPPERASGPPGADLILVLTNPCDEVADRVISELRRRGAIVARFDPAELPQRTTLTMDVSAGEVRAEIYRSWAPGLDFDQVRSIWYRRPGDFVIPPYQRRQTAQFARSELTAALNGVLRSLECFWMNSPGAITEASFKAEQLARAVRLGLRVPATCITSQPADARAFFRAHDGQIIIKALGDARVYSPNEGRGLVGSILTSTVLPDALAKFDRVKDAPVLLQEHIRKQFDIRVTIVEDSVFAVAIDSQGNPASAVDWRPGGPELPHRVIELPPGLAGRLIALTRSYGLSFGCIDLVLSTDDQYVFLELNPLGEWGWLERVTGLDITGSIATALLAADPGPRPAMLSAEAT